MTLGRPLGWKCIVIVLVEVQTARKLAVMHTFIVAV